MTTTTLTRLFFFFINQRSLHKEYKLIAGAVLVHPCPFLARQIFIADLRCRESVTLIPGDTKRYDDDGESGHAFF